MPYSVSMPQIFGMAMTEGYASGRTLEVLPRLDLLDLTGPSPSFVLADEGADVDDALALLAGDLRPVVGVGGVRAGPRSLCTPGGWRRDQVVAR